MNIHHVGIIASSRPKDSAAFVAGLPSAVITSEPTVQQTVTTTHELIVTSYVNTQINWPWTIETEFTVPAGINYVVASMIINGTGSNSVQSGIQLRKNNVPIYERIKGAHFWLPHSARAVIEVTPGDTLGFYIIKYSTFATIDGGKSRVCFMGW